MPKIKLKPIKPKPNPLCSLIKAAQQWHCTHRSLVKTVEYGEICVYCQDCGAIAAVDNDAFHKRKRLLFALRLQPTIRTCVHCGCTTDKACPGGCDWHEVHRCTPTGVCTRCAPRYIVKFAQSNGAFHPVELDARCVTPMRG